MGDETATQTYVVQIEDQLLLKDVGEGEGPGGGVVWSDIATVTVPSRTHRKTVIEKALAESGAAPKPGTQIKVRVLDADSALVTPVGSVQPPAQLVIGG